MTQRVSPHSRHAIERAKFFLAKAKECPAESREDFKAYLEASIIFGRSAIQRVQAAYKEDAVFKNKFKIWWDSLENDESVVFLKEERDMILHEAPPRIGQILQTPLIPASGHVGGQPVEDDELDVPTIKSEEPSYASELYYYGDDPSIPATQTVEDHLKVLENHIHSFLNDINNS